MNNKTLIEKYVKNQLATSPQWAIKALVKVYTLQTESEKAAGATYNLNGVGFSGIDSRILSSFAVQVNNGRNLSAKQTSILFRRMPRYWRQVISFIPESKMAELEAKAIAAHKPALPSTKEITENFPAATK